MKNTSSKVEDVFGDVISKDYFSQEQIKKFNSFLAKKIVNVSIKINFNFFEPKKKKTLILNPLLLPNIQNFSK